MGQIGRKAHREDNQVRRRTNLVGRTDNQDCGSYDGSVVHPQVRMEVPQPFRLGRSLILNNHFAFGLQNVFREGTTWKRLAVKSFPNPAGE